MKNTKETFKLIQGSNYSVSDKGNVINTKTSKLLRGSVNSSGYKLVQIKVNGKIKSCTIHSLVAQAFLGHIPKGFKSVVDHIDNNPLNNEASNLQIITQRENCSKDKAKGNYSSKIVGVHYSTKGKKYVASIRFNSKKIGLGSFMQEETAGIVYEIAKRITRVDATVEDRLLMIENMKKKVKKIK